MAAISVIGIDYVVISLDLL